MAPPRAGDLSIEALAAFDDEALTTFLDPADGGVEIAVLALACQGAPPALVERIRASLRDEDQARFDAATSAPAPGTLVEASCRVLIEKLFWPLVYWNEPDEYDELVSGERLHPALLTVVDLAGLRVCDIGAGSGRFTLAAARVAREVVAVDVVPALLELLAARAADAGLHNIEVRRARFSNLPFPDASFDVAVACSAFTSEGPHGGERALREAERIVRPGGHVLVIWPPNPDWFTDRGYTHQRFSGNEVVHFRDADAAERLCRRYHSDEAAQWVARHDTGDVPYSVLGVEPPNDVCVKRITPSR